jgi:hypothetical protein
VGARVAFEQLAQLQLLQGVQSELRQGPRGVHRLGRDAEHLGDPLAQEREGLGGKGRGGGEPERVQHVQGAGEEVLAAGVALDLPAGGLGDGARAHEHQRVQVHAVGLGHRAPHGLAERVAGLALG